MATPLPYPVSRRKSLEALWHTTAWLTLFSRHVLWDVWCSSCSVLQPYLSISEMIGKLSLVSLEPGSCPQNILSMVGNQVGPTAEVGQGSISLEAGELLVAQKASLEQGTSLAQHIRFRKMRRNVVYCWHADSSADGHLPHLLGNVKPALCRHC